MMRLGKAISTAFGRISAFYKEEVSKVYDALKGNASFDIRKKHISPVRPVALSAGRIFLLVILLPVSPLVFGAVGAFFAHNIRAGIEISKAIINSLYFEKVLRPHESHLSFSARSVVRFVSFPGAFLGGLIGTIAAATWANILAVPHMMRRMTNLAAGKILVAPGGNNMKPIARYGLGVLGSILGGVIGILPFLAVGGFRVLVASRKAFLQSVGLPRSILVELWQGNSLGELIKGHRQDLKRVQALGYPGLALGYVVGVIPAAVVFVAGTIRFFSLSFYNAFRRVYNVVTPKENELVNRPEKTLFQEYGFGWLGVILGTLVGLAASSMVVLMRVMSNSARLFMSTAKGILKLTFNGPDVVGFDRSHLEKDKRYRLAFGLPGMITALCLVGIPCAIWQTGKVAFYAILMAVTFPFVLVTRLTRETIKYFRQDMTFSQNNQGLHQPFEHFMHSLFSKAVDWDGELIKTKTQISVTDNHPDDYTQGFFKHLLKHLRKALSLDQRTDVENFLHEVLATSRQLEETSDLSARDVQSIAEKFPDNQSVQSVCQVIEDYIEKRVSKSVEIDPPKPPSWTQSFFAKAPQHDFDRYNRSHPASRMSSSASAAH